MSVGKWVPVNAQFKDLSKLKVHHFFQNFFKSLLVLQPVSPLGNRGHEGVPGG
jgi:hypothetical protein